jgi:uncharacterized membrane protein YdbT with pleckstrin-like domain
MAATSAQPRRGSSRAAAEPERQALAFPSMDLHPGEEIVFEGHPSWRSVLRFYIGGVVLVAIAAAIGEVASGTGIAILAGVVALALVLLFGFLKRLSTRYVITTERLHIRRGILSKATQETRIQRVQNVNTDQSLFERLLQVGTVDFDTAGTDDSEFRFVGVADPRNVVRAVDRAQRSQSAQTGDPLA